MDWNEMSQALRPPLRNLLGNVRNISEMRTFFKEDPWWSKELRQQNISRIQGELTKMAKETVCPPSSDPPR
jgi:hypothetical protein